MLGRVFQIMYLTGRCLVTARTLWRDSKEILDLLGILDLFTYPPDDGQDL